MKSISLCHRRGLNYPVCHEIFDAKAFTVSDPDRTTVVTFAKTGMTARKMDARDRLQGLPEEDVVLSFFDTSPLTPLLVWDVAHQLPVGRKLYLHMSDNATELLKSSYYQAMFREHSAIAGLRCFTKLSPLPAESARGLDEWSFCIPTGSGDPAMLNACVARILSLGIPTMEIILCGRPRQDFLFWSEVRIVGEDIPCPPMHITRKKNVLAQTARYPNLCILHDRVLLPVNFYDAVRDFGDDYPFTAFASFWFADTWQALPRRYSDFGAAKHVPDSLRTAKGATRECLAALSGLEFMAQHPARCDFGREYLTGSLYLCKSSVWATIPQNEALYWQEWEDVEQGIRASIAGIPSRLNPYALTQTLGYRSIMHRFGYLTGPSLGGRHVTQRPPQEWWGFPRRPHLQLTQAELRSRLARFAQRYTGSDRAVQECRQPLTGLRRYFLIARLLWAARGETDTLLEDWYRDVICEAPVPSEEASLRAMLESDCGPVRIKLAWLRHPTLLRQVFNNPFSSAATMPDCRPVPPRGIRRSIGCLVSAIWLRYGYAHVAFNLSVWQLFHLIRDGACSHQEYSHETD